MFRKTMHPSHATPNPTAKPSSRSPSKPKPSPGLFHNTVWHCDCTPRLPAERFQVRKQNANHGRWFYTCQKANSGSASTFGAPGRQQREESRRRGREGCGFFLWREEAEEREERVVLRGKRSEDGGVGMGQGTCVLESKTRGLDEARSDRGGGGGDDVVRAAKKRKLPWLTNNDDDDGADKVDMGKLFEGEDRARRATDSTTPPTPDTTDEEANHPTVHTVNSPKDHAPAPKQNALPNDSSNRKADIKPAQQPQEPTFETPRKAQKFSHETLPTPGTTPHTTSPHPNKSQASHHSITEPPTPTPLRNHPIPFPTSTEKAPPTPTLTTRVFALLPPPGTSMRLDVVRVEEIRALLDAHARRVEGLIRGRDAARGAVAERDRRIAELVGRVGGLETECEGLRALAGDLRRGKGRRIGGHS